MIPWKGFDWVIDFNGMSTRLGLFYAKKFGNRVHCTLVFAFLCGCFFSSFVLFYFHTVQLNTNNRKLFDEINKTDIFKFLKNVCFFFFSSFEGEVFFIYLFIHLFIYSF